MNNPRRARPRMLTGGIMTVCYFFALLFLVCVPASDGAPPGEQRRDPNRIIAVIPEDGPPTFYRNKQTNKADGFAVDITNEVAKRAGFTVSYLFRDNWDAIRDTILRGDADIGPGLTISAEREQYYAFSEPFDIFSISLFARTGAGDELAPHASIGVIRGSVADELLSRRADIQLVPYDGFETGLFDLLSGKIDAFAGPSPVLWHLAAEAGVEDHVVVMGKPVAEMKRAFGLRKDRPELLALLNKALDGFVGSPEYQKIYTKWYGKPRPFLVLSRQSLLIMIVLLLAAVAMATWRHLSVMSLTRRLKHEIEERNRTEESYRVLFDQDPLPGWIYDTDTFRFLLVNKAAEQHYGYSAEEFSSMTIKDIRPEEDIDRLTNFSAHISGKPAASTSWKHRKKDGSLIHVEINSHPVLFKGRKARRIIVKDITERKKTEEALQISEARFREIADNMMDLVAQFDEKAFYLYVSPSYEKVLGYRSKELIGTWAPGLLHPDDRDKDIQSIDSMLRSQSGKVEFRFRHQDGSYRWIESTGRNLINAQGQVLGSVIGSRDITERKQAEKEREQFFRFFQTSADIMVIADPNGAFLRTNPACTELLGYSAEELVAKPFVEFIHPDDKQATLDEMARQQQRGSSLNFENRYLCKDGSFKWMSWRAIYNKEEGITYATARDITERTLMERALRESEMKYRALVETTNTGFVIINDQGAIIDANPEYVRLTGCDKLEDILGRTILEWTDEADREKNSHAVKKCMEQGYVRNLEIHYRTKDGVVIPVEVNATVVQTGEGGKIFSLCRDITDRKQAEAQILRSLKEKEVLLKEVHHRVKNNMQVIYSLLNLQAKSVTDMTVRAMFEESRNRVNSMSLIHEKLYRSKDLAHVDFKEYLQNLGSGIAETYKRHDVVVSVDMEPLALDVNVGIPCGLIVNELVSNCFKYAFPGGRAGRITVGINRNSEGNNVLTVADNGVGLPETLDIRNTTTLGLQLVTVLAGQIGGTMEFSRAGGTCFNITFAGG